MVITVSIAAQNALTNCSIGADLKNQKKMAIMHMINGPQTTMKGIFIPMKLIFIKTFLVNCSFYILTHESLFCPSYKRLAQKRQISYYISIMVNRMRATRAHRDNRRSHHALDEARFSNAATAAPRTRATPSA